MLLHTQIDIFTDTALFPIQMGLAKKKEKNNLFLSFFLYLFPAGVRLEGWQCWFIRLSFILSEFQVVETTFKPVKQPTFPSVSAATYFV